MQNQKPLILIVDDVPENIQVLLQILENEKYRFAIATNAADTFKSIDAEKPDLILLDIILPDISGYEICKQLKDDPATEDIPIIFLTVLDEMENVLKGFSLGAVDYVTKPFNEHEVLARVNTQLRLQQANHKLKELNKTKDKLFSVIAHEIRNPFSNIINFSEIMLENIDNSDKENLKKILTGIREDSLKSFEMLENLLMWSRSQLKSNIQINMQPILLKEVVDGVLAFNKDIIAKKNLTIKNSVARDTMIFADMNLTGTIVRNLISNAIKFTSDGEIDLYDKNTNDYVDFFVQDTGTGIPTENLDKIFDLNYFTTKGTSNESGTGLGLIITKEFIEQNNGTITVESKPGKGSIFKVKFLKVN
jgi:two-component system, sensor histidine kinase and response regulator